MVTLAKGKQSRRCGYAGNGVSRAGVVVTLAKSKQNVSACIFDVVTSCACALEPRIYNDCGNWSGPYPIHEHSSILSSVI